MQLKFPVTWGNVTVSEITFHRAKGKDIKRINKAYDKTDPYEAGIFAVSLLSGVAIEAFDEMDGQDIADAMTEMRSFLPVLPKDTDG